MDDPIKGRFVSGDELASELRARRRSVVHDSIRSGSSAARDALVAQRVNEGWRVRRRFKTAVRLEKDKGSDERLEDELWVLMAAMGFPHMSQGRLFKANLDGTFRQLDGVAADDETVVVVECTQTDLPTSKSMKGLLEKVASWRRSSRAYSGFRIHFDNRALQVAFVIATRRIEWSRNDLRRAQEHNIIVIRDEQIDYFARLVSHLKSAARYQFLAHVFREREVPGLRLSVPATKAQISNKTFYSCLVPPADLLKIAYVSHKASANLDSMETYQRLVTPKRLREIAKFIDGSEFGGTFPTNIVLNLHSRKIRFEKKETLGKVQVGTLHLPNVYGSAFVVDGQHRLFGYAHSQRAKNRDDKTTFSVLAYENLDAHIEAKMFVDINSEQKQVAKGLLDELKAFLHRGARDFTSRTGALVSKLVQDLNRRSDSKLNGRVRLTGNKASALRCLSITQLADPMLKHQLFGDVRRGGQEVPGPLSDSNTGTMEGDEEKGYECLRTLFNFVAETGPRQYCLGNSPGGYLWTNIGVRPLIGVFAAALGFVARRQHLDLDMYSPSQFMPEICDLVKPVVLYFERGDRNDVQAFRDRTGMKGVAKNEFEMMRIIRNHTSRFEAPGLDDYEAQLDVEGTKEARDLINELELRMHNFILGELEKEYGRGRIGGLPRWWREGVPERIRTDCAAKLEKDRRPKDFPWQYLSLINHRDIVIQPGVWSKRFEAIFTFGERGKKEDRTKWMVHLNDIRNTTHHVIKGVCTRDEVNQVRAWHGHVTGKLTAVSR